MEPGQRLLPHVVEQLAETDPSGTWVSFAQDISTSKFRDISYKELANAVNKAAGSIRRSFGAERQYIAYIGPSDASYLIFIVAALKAGHVLFLLSPRNSTSTQRRLMQALNCTSFMCPEAYGQQVTGIIQGLDTKSTSYKLQIAPELGELLSAAKAEPCSFTCTFDKERHSPFVALHTSGTTREPKPIVLPNGYYACEDLLRSHVPFMKEGMPLAVPFTPGTRILHAGPLFHAAGIQFPLLKGLLQKCTIILHPADLPLSAKSVHSCLTAGRADILGTSPAMLEKLCENNEHKKALAGLKAIFWGAGPTPQPVGEEVVSTNKNAYHVFGSTETGLLPMRPLHDAVKDWQYHSFHPSSGVDFRPSSDKRLYELVMKRTNSGWPQPCFEIWPDLPEYRSGDLFSAHPTKVDLWKFEGRADEVITLSNGEKFCPLPMEDIIASHPDVATALIVGQGRFQPALLLNMRHDTKVLPDTIGRIWPAVRAANECAPGFGRISRGLCAVVREPFHKTPKGTIQRRKTMEDLSAVIDLLYDQYDESYAGLGDLESINPEMSVRHPASIDSSSNRTSTVIDFRPDADLFANGLDSLQVTELVWCLNRVLKRAGGGFRGRRVTAEMVYRCRSISGIAEALSLHLSSFQEVRTSAPRLEAQRKPLSQHVQSLCPIGQPVRPGQASETLMRCVVLTGSTGSLGTYILHSLLHRPETAHIYCLNRCSRAQQRHLDAFPADIDHLSHTTFVQTTNLAAPHLGIKDPSIYADLRDYTTTIIHNAWPINLIYPDRAFIPHISGLRNLLALAATAPHTPQLVFISSLAAVLRSTTSTPHAATHIPERVVDDPAAPASCAYARSKWLAERVLHASARASAPHLSSSAAAAPPPRRPKIIRLGQISGPSPRAPGTAQGRARRWNPCETWPALVRSSVAVGALPRSLGQAEKARWVPVDVAAGAVVEIAGAAVPAAGTETGAVVYNCTNVAMRGREVAWSADIAPFIKTWIERRSVMPLEIIPLSSWIRRVENYGLRNRNAASGCGLENPAIQLTSVYAELGASHADCGLGGVIERDRALEASASLRGVEPVDAELLGSWLMGWGL